MRNTITIDMTNDCACSLIANVDDGSNSVFLEVISDVSKNPALSIHGTKVTIDRELWQYQISKDWYTGSENLTFYFSDNSHTGKTFTIIPAKEAAGNLFLKQIDDFTYQLCDIKKSKLEDMFEPKITRSNAGVYYKDGYTCHLHAWWQDATDVFFTLGANFRPKSYVTCVGFCQRKDDAKTFPLMCELEESGSWQVWAMTGIGVSGGQSMWTVYQPANGIDHRSEFTVCITGSWLTNSNGG